MANVESGAVASTKASDAAKVEATLMSSASAPLVFFYKTKN